MTGSQGHKKIVGVNWDVTDDVRLQEDLRRAKQVSDLQNTQLEEARLVMESAAMHDALTGLINRHQFELELDAALIDKDGTLVENVPYSADPALLPAT